MTCTALCADYNKTIGESHVMGSGQVDVSKLGKPDWPCSKAVWPYHSLGHIIQLFASKNEHSTLKHVLNGVWNIDVWWLKLLKFVDFKWHCHRYPETSCLLMPNVYVWMRQLKRVLMSSVHSKMQTTLKCLVTELGRADGKIFSSWSFVWPSLRTVHTAWPWAKW